MNKWYAVLGLGLLGCGASTSAADGPPGLADGGATDASTCTPKATLPCSCPGGADGTQTCGADGRWGACGCLAFDASFDQKTDAKAVCGDQTCEADKGETCVDCPTDCGQCPQCDLAPTCTGAASVPTTSSPLDSFGFDRGANPSYVSQIDGGVPIDKTNCTAPQLKMAVTAIKVYKDGTGGLFGDPGVDLFCSVTSSDAQSSELLLTPLQKGLKDNAPVVPLQVTLGTFWGQPQALVGDAGAMSGVAPPKLSQSNIQISYQCYRVESPDAFQNALGAIAGVAGVGAGVPGNPYGWAFGLGSAAAAAIQAAIAQGNGAFLRLNVIQTIAAESLLDLTNGRTWKIRQSGNENGKDWDWELSIQTWGCSTARIGGSTN